MAKALELNTMNCSRLTARIAGTESTANTTSVVSIRTSTANSGVASRLPFSPGEQLLAVVLGGRRDDPPDEPQREVLLGVDLGLVVAGDLPRR